MKKAVVFKGAQGGLELLLDDQTSFEVIVDEVCAKFTETQSFFKDAGIEITFSGRRLNDQQQAVLENRILTVLGDSSNASFKYKEPQSEKSKEEETEKKKTANSMIMSAAFENSNSKFFKGTVRSGQRVASCGDLIIVGDVNPGGEAVASGNIVVLGHLRGLAHAGRLGNRKNFIAALYMKPTQLRIGDIYTFAPDNDKKLKSNAEMAYVKGEEVLVTPL